MDTNKNNIAINEFSGGMNSDLSYGMLQPNQYVYGENIRLTSNSLINQNEIPGKKEGVITSVPEGILEYATENLGFRKVLASAHIDDINILIVETYENQWIVYRITDGDPITATKIINRGGQVTDKNKFSIVINKEVNGIIKLYIADGVHQIMTMNVNPEFDQYNLNITDASMLVSNSYFPANKMYIINKISGRMPVGQVQYTYRFYKKYGIKSKLAPMTNKIQIVDSTRNKEEGNAEGTNSSIGLQLQAWCDEKCLRLFDRIQIFRIYYKHIDTDAEIELIYDDKLPEGQDNIRFNDIGQDALKTYTAEEFSVLDGQDIIPTCIEQNQGYMFAANVEDKTMFNPSIYGFDARSYSANRYGTVRLYHNTDTEYERQPISFSINQIPSDVSSEYTLNKYSDMSIDKISLDVSSSNTDLCRYDKDGYLGGTGKNVSWRFITTAVPIHKEALVSYDSGANSLPPNGEGVDVSVLKYLKADSSTQQDGRLWDDSFDEFTVDHEIDNEQNYRALGSYTTKSYFEQQCVTVPQNITYNDVFASSLLRSLRRDEVYRYGIILYDNEGKKSDVNWIADIKTPDTCEYPLTKLDMRSQAESFISYNDYRLSDSFQQVAERMRGGTYDPVTYTKTGYLQSAAFDIPAGYNLYFTENNSIVTVDLSQYRNFYISQGHDQPDRYELMFSKTGITSTLENIRTSVLAATQREENSYIYGFNFSISRVTVCFNGIEVDLSTYRSNQEYINQRQQNAYLKVYYTQEIALEHVYNKKSVKVELTTYLNAIIYVSTGNTVGPSQQLTDYLYFGKPIGIQFSVHDLPENIIGYQIVRCSKNLEHRKNIMQCIVARPMKQLIKKDPEKIKSPYYPHYILTSNQYQVYTYTRNSNGPITGYSNSNIYVTDGTGTESYDACIPGAYAEDMIFQLYSPEITNRRIDSLQAISDSTALQFFGFWKITGDMPGVIMQNGPLMFPKQDITYYGLLRNSEQGTLSNKESASIQRCYYNYVNYPNKIIATLNQIQDVKNPLWDEAYGNVQLGSTGNTTSGIIGATKQYKSYVSSVGDKEYLNWICNAMYDIKAFKGDINRNQTQDGNALTIWHENGYAEEFGYYFATRTNASMGLIGPGPVCFVASANQLLNESGQEINLANLNYITTQNENSYLAMGTAVANIQHRPIQYAGLSNSEKQLDIYYGFGDFRNIKNGSNSLIVFDGDVYIVPFEIVQMFKAYDFNSYDTLESGQFVYYIPIESPINTFFDYGMNYKNTQSKTLQLEPGEITGVAVQDRPLSQYNLVMSDNSSSNDVYNAQSNEDNVSVFNQRIFYSDPKISGEYIDSWLNFAPLNYLDVDSRYGNITCLRTLKDVIYVWQEKAFGKISVNERSLVADTNNNMVQLGQGGVMQRIDYIDTRYGMSAGQFVCVPIGKRMFWIDDKNKAVVVSDGQEAINFSERTNVQSILNQRFYNNDMSIHYDIQSDELLCKCLTLGNQLVFNTKLNIATSVYTRAYEDLLNVNNSLCGITNNFSIYKFSNITNEEIEALMPSSLIFVVNNNTSITKVFDNQEVVLSNTGNSAKYFTNNVMFSFNTNIDEMYTRCRVQSTSREGNIQYAIPRANNAEYGQRMRGKWLKVGIENNGNMNSAISHVITKFRQSF